MSRSTVAKSRTEKGGKSSSAATPAVTHEIIPGKFNDQDWNAVLEHDEGDDFILDIVEDVCTSALDIIFANYIQRQLVPYTVLQAKDAIIQIIEWQFLTRDDGEQSIDSEAGWQQDEEPTPAVTDCWAQGSVPRSHVPPKTPDDLRVQNLEVLEEEQEGDLVEQSPHDDEAKDPCENEEDGGRAEVEVEAEGEEEEGVSSVPMEESVQEEATTPAPSQEKSAEVNNSSLLKKKKRFRPHKGKLKSAGVSKMTESLEETEFKMMLDEHPQVPVDSPDPGLLQMPSSCQSLIKLQAGRPPGHRDVLFDDAGNVVGVTKIDPDKLPAHKVKTRFQVVDPAVEAAQARLDAMRKGRKAAMAPHPPSQPQRTNTSGGKSIRTYSISSKASRTFGGSTLEGMAGLPPPLIEAMEVSPGVVVREGDRVKAGPRQHPRKTDLIALATQRGLRPINMKAHVPTIALTDLLEHQTPLVKPITETSPIPPITTPPIGTQ